jgi:hypothetical protein
MKRSPQSRWKSNRPERAQHDATPVHFAERVIDAVDAGAGHNAKNVHLMDN